MTATPRTNTDVRSAAVMEDDAAFTAETPFLLARRTIVEPQPEIEALRDMGSATRTDPLLRVCVVKHGLTFVA